MQAHDKVVWKSGWMIFGGIGWGFKGFCVFLQKQAKNIVA